MEAWPVKDLLHLATHDFWKLPIRIREAYDKVEVLFAASSIHIHTLEGIMIAEKGDFLIQGVENELYPCKPDIFEKTYEPVEEEE